MTCKISFDKIKKWGAENRFEQATLNSIKMNASTVTTIEPSNKSALKRFISLERKLMKNYAYYISEIDDDVAKMLTQRRCWLKRWN